MKEKIAELESKLREADSNTGEHTVEKVDALNGLAWELRSNDPVQSLSYARQAYELAGQHFYSRGVAYGLMNLGVAQRYLADYESALASLLQAHSLFGSIDDRQGQAGTLNWIGNVYLRMGNYPSALDYYLQSSVISEELNDSQLTASCLTNIGRVYYGMGDYTHSLDYHLRSLRLREDMTDRLEEAMVSWDISRTYYGMEEFDNALLYCLHSLRIRRNLRDFRGMAASLHVLGDIYQKTGDYFRALLNYRRALVAVQIVDEKYGEAMTNSRVGALCLQLNRPDKAFPYLHKALEIAGHIKAHEVEYETHHLLYELYKKQNDYQQALHHFELFYALRSDVTSRQAEQTLQSVQRGHEIEKAQKEAEIYRLKNVELADALQEVQILNENLAQVNIHLEALNKEKNEFLGIVAHDLQNPLAGVSMTASLVRSYIGKMQAEDVKQHMEKIERTIDRMKEIIVNLLDINAIESGKLRLSLESIDVTALILSVLSEYVPRARSKEIALHYTPSSPVYAWVDRQATLQILDNLISNAVKYSPIGTSIWLEVSGTEGLAMVEVRDEGPGLTHEDKKNLFGKFARLSAKPTGGELSTGLGLSIVKKLVEAMNGGVRCESMEGQGATFIVELPRTPANHYNFTAATLP